MKYVSDKTKKMERNNLFSMGKADTIPSPLLKKEICFRSLEQPFEKPINPQTRKR